MFLKQDRPTQKEKFLYWNWKTKVPFMVYEPVHLTYFKVFEISNRLTITVASF